MKAYQDQIVFDQDGLPRTYFASPERTEADDLQAEIEFASDNPVISGLLESISGLIAILDENRQIVALNNTLLEVLGIDDPGLALGLRLGEALQCIHAGKDPAGCGTTRYCSTCGAAIAMVTCLENNNFVEKVCSLTARSGDEQVDKALLVKAHPLKIGKKRFLLLFIQDITRDQQRAALERAFFHDINNMLTLLQGASEAVVDNEPSRHSKLIHKATSRLVEEVAIQRFLSSSESTAYEPNLSRYSGKEILEELEAFYSDHPIATDKEVDISREYEAAIFWTDISLLMRVLCNMITNGLEASGRNGYVRVWIEEEEDGCHSFNVWNEQGIEEPVTRRIFQLNFSTKNQAGRGIGTYSMKLLGEKILKGRVSFTTSPVDGTIFKFVCPHGGPDKDAGAEASQVF